MRAILGTPLPNSAADLRRWIEANEKAAEAYRRLGAPVEEAIMRNAAKEQRRELAAIECDKTSPLGAKDGGFVS